MKQMVTDNMVIMIAEMKITCNLKDKHGATKTPPPGTFVRADKQKLLKNI